MKHLFVVLLLAVPVACVGDGEEGSKRGGGPSNDVDCPAVPDQPQGKLVSMIWPGDSVRDLVPDFVDLCATPTSPYLPTLLDEAVSWSSELQASAQGILHRGGEVLATFSVSRVVADVADEAEQSIELQEATTVVGGLTMAWGAGGKHVVVFWAGGQDIVALSAAGADAAAEWLNAAGQGGAVSPPQEIPQPEDMPSALDVGPPIESLSGGYSALVLNPMSFIRSDFADAVTIHKERSVKALGAAIVISDDGKRLIGTVVAGLGRSQGLEQRQEEFDGLGPDVVADGFTAADTDVLVVGYDSGEVSRFTSAWEESVSS